MCLNTITKHNINQSGKGWKVFGVHQGALKVDIWGENAPLPLQQWLCEKDYRLRWNKNDQRIAGKYPFGWHIFLRKKHAKRWASGSKVFEKVVEKVAYRKGHTLGMQMGGTVVVATEMMICAGKERVGGESE